MKLASSDQAVFTVAHRYLVQSLPKVLHIGSIVDSFCRHARMTPAEMATALSYGTLPKIALPAIPIARACGQTVLHREEIEVARELARRLQRSRTGPNLQLFGITILHEMVHWANMRRGRLLSYEEGEQFEKDAYGAIFPCA